MADKVPESATVRRQLEEAFATDADLDAFCLDFFPEVHRRFGGTMDRKAKINLLLTLQQPGLIAQKLSPSPNIPPRNTNERMNEEAQTKEKPPASALRWYQAFGAAMMTSAALITIVFLICWRIYKRDQSAPWGLPNSLAFFIASAYGPVICVIFTGYHDAIFRGNEPSSTKSVQGAGFLYPLALSGALSALGVLIYVATGVDDTDAKLLVAATATYWGSTVGWTLAKLFRRFTMD